MARLLALLTIPLLVFGNGLPHSHGDTYANSDHGVRPHFHHGCFHCDHEHDDHEHGHEDDQDHDHDSDAVYFSGGQFYLSHAAEIKVDSSSSEYLVAACFDSSSLSKSYATAREVPIPGGPPLFLLHAALRL